MTVYLYIVYTESGDVHSFVFDKQPTAERLEEVLREEMGSEFEFIAEISGSGGEVFYA